MVNTKPDGSQVKPARRQPLRGWHAAAPDSTEGITHVEETALHRAAASE